VRTLVVGLRATGASVARYLGARGDEVTIVEDTPGQPGYEARRAEACAAGQTVVDHDPDWPRLVADADLVVPSPGVPPRHPVMVAAATAGVPVRGDLDLAVEAATMPVVVVTGTTGKSTVTTLVGRMLEASGRRAPAVGNLGRVALDALDDDADVLVIEASSFQLATVTATFAPDVAVLLNLAPDHLDWHGSYERYVADKCNVFRHQAPDGTLVANADDPGVVAAAVGAPARRSDFALTAAPGRTGWDERGLRGADGRLLIAATAKDVPVAPHDRANVAAAAAVAAVLGAGGAVGAGLAGFTRLHHRTEPVGKAGGVTYVDDSKATNPHAVLAAVRGYPNVVLVAGGDAKGVDLGELRAVSDRLRGVVAIGATPEVVEAAFAGVVPVERAADMAGAVRLATALARPGDVVLLSPACASFDWYSGYEARGDDFRHEVEALIAGMA
jgi:UDP-N-acetylmuramoylalanine--D-glutamate ligase